MLVHPSSFLSKSHAWYPRDYDIASSSLQTTHDLGSMKNSRVHQNLLRNFVLGKNSTKVEHFKAAE